nr:MAG TPA: hypothetical protein [Bacteriophage sp.]
MTVQQKRISDKPQSHKGIGDRKRLGGSNPPCGVLSFTVLRNTPHVRALCAVNMPFSFRLVLIPISLK